ncbi:FUSC family protein [Paenibacillus hamazuiensis]|uniref:FUSC family protein n=1 Tax=Paenibacillus hamazuiensis TaxID=2936508 RepID=UPI00200D52A9|nr:FUSC family protein [Paenibacillus hamazuiensis]
MNRNKKQSSTLTGMMIAKIAVACAVSWQLAKLSGSSHPYLAPVSVILCMKSTLLQTLKFSGHRAVGTIIGACFVELVSRFLNEPHAWTIGFLVLVGLWIAKGLRRNPIVSEQVGLTVLLVLVLDHQSDHYFVDRLRDTGIGVVLSAIILYAVPPNYKKEMKQAAAPFADRLSKMYTSAAAWVGRGCDNGEGEKLRQEMKQLLELELQTRKTLTDISKSLKFYPFFAQKQNMAAGFKKQFQLWSYGQASLERMADLLSDWRNSGHMSAADRAGWSGQLSEIAAYYRRQAEMLQAKGSGGSAQTDVIFKEHIPLHVRPPERLDSNSYNSALYLETAALVREHAAYKIP